jgi:hypothetical protein
MNESPDRLFGLTIAYVLPGFVSLWGASNFSPIVSNWLSLQPEPNPSLASFLYALLASLGAGLVVSAVRWLLIDTFHHRTGVRFPDPDFSKVQEKLEAFQLAIELYYRYYQFYANMLVAITIAAACRFSAGQTLRGSAVAAGAIVWLVLLAASRDSLSRYYARVAQLLGTRRREAAD